MEEFANKLQNLIQSAFRECDVNLRQQLHSCPNKCRIALPQYLIDILLPTQLELTNQVTLFTKFNGVEIVPGYDNALVIYFIDFNYTNDPGMIFKVPFSVKIDTNKTTVTLGDLKTF